VGLQLAQLKEARLEKEVRKDKRKQKRIDTTINTMKKVAGSIE